jgi:predicted transposase YdaD
MTGTRTKAEKNDRKKKERFDSDGLWKDLIERFFYDFLKRALPELYADADTSVKPRFLDKEFRDILNTADPEIHTSPHFADYLLETPLKNKKVEWVLSHFEAQGAGGGDIAERMNHYRCLVFGHYKREPVALAVITEKRPRGEAVFYSHSHYGTTIDYRYNRLVLADVNDEELLSSDNPIDLALYAAKCALRSKENEHQKYKYLRTLTGLLGERGYSMNDKRDLLLFLERFINLKDGELRSQYREYQEQLDKEGKIVYISVAEEYYTGKGIEKGIEQGIEKGIEKGKEEMARNLLANGVPPDVIAKSAGLPLRKIRTLMN